MHDAILEADHISKTFGDGRRPVEAIADHTFQVRAGEFCCIVGPSGCGKTTLLKVLGGLLQPTGGVARLHGRPIMEPPPKTAFVFQDYSRSLLPWTTVLKNVMLPLRAKRLPKDEKR